MEIQGRNYPFLILREYGSTKKYAHRLKEIFQILDQHPGLIEEIWFAYSPRNMTEAKKEVELLRPFVDECKKRNIRFSAQQGITLGHGEISAPSAVGEGGNIQLAPLPENAWSRAADGHCMWGVLCPRSKDTWRHLYDLTVYLLTELELDSYWPDDDFRLGFCKSPCFCPRCIKAFNKRYAHTFTRKTLVKALYDKIDPAIRREWGDFQQESLAICAEKSYRKAFDDIKTKCRIGIQLVASEDLLHGKNYTPLYKALAGKSGEAVSIRPGSGYYDDAQPRDMFSKAISIARECARSRKSGLVGQMCFETENWPHISAKKTPESQMRECALAMFNGVDSLALYWYSFATYESQENYQFFFDTVAAYRPYFESIRKVCADTELTGIAPYFGENSVLDPTYHLPFMQLDTVLFSGIPYTVAEAAPQVYGLNQKLAGFLTEKDAHDLLTKNVILDVAAYRELQKIIPDHPVFSKIQLADNQPQWKKYLPGTIVLSGEHYRFQAVAPILKQSDDVRSFSTILEMPEAAGHCIIPTGDGGNLLLIPHLNTNWTTPLRKAVQDMLDDAVPEKLSARLLTGGFSLSMQTRVNRSGRTSAIYLQNASVGRTMPLEIAIRRPAEGDYYLYRGFEAPQKLQCRCAGDELLVTIPPLYAWQGALIAVDPV